MNKIKNKAMGNMYLIQDQIIKVIGMITRKTSSIKSSGKDAPHNPLIRYKAPIAMIMSTGRISCNSMANIWHLLLIV